MLAGSTVSFVWNIYLSWVQHVDHSGSAAVDSKIFTVPAEGGIIMSGGASACGAADGGAAAADGAAAGGAAAGGAAAGGAAAGGAAADSAVAGPNRALR